MFKKTPLPGNKKWNELSFTQKLQYFWDYYKLPSAAALILIYIAGFSLKVYITRQDPILYAAMVNIAVSEDLERHLIDDYMWNRMVDPAKNPLLLYKNLYLTDNPSSEVFEYTQASQMKILAAIEAQELDIVFMDQEAFDAFAQNGFLYDIDQLLDEYKEGHPDSDEYTDELPDPNEATDELPDLNEYTKDSPDLISKTEGYLVINMEIKEDNAKEIALDPAAEYYSVTDEYTMGINLLSSPLFQDSGFTEPVYLGILNNTPRKDHVLDYIEYLYSG